LVSPGDRCAGCRRPPVREERLFPDAVQNSRLRPR
jgi:hypothetical protein